MGYSRDRFVRPVHSELVCGVCLGVLHAATLTACGHAFCDECARRWLLANRECGKCPECRAPCRDEQLRPVWPLRRLIDTLKLFCSYQLRGCQVLLSVETAAAHEMTCAFAPPPPPQLQDTDSLPDNMRFRVARLEENLTQVRHELDEAERRNRRLETDLTAARQQLDISALTIVRSRLCKDTLNQRREEELGNLRHSLLPPSIQEEEREMQR